MKTEFKYGVNFLGYLLLRSGDMTVKPDFCYEWFQHKYENTKPIRGRASDVRPIGKRARDWELLVKEDRADGAWYGALLYRTNVVMYGPNGQLELKVDSYATPKTADFMQQHSPFRVRKVKNNIWVNARGVGDVPILKHKTVKFQVGADGNWHPVEPVRMTQKIVDRKKSGEIRKRVKGFIDYATTMMKLSDGWVRHDTVDKWFKLDESKDGYRHYRFDFGFEEPLKGIIQGSLAGRWLKENTVHHQAYLDSCEQVIQLMETEDHDTWDRLMYAILENKDQYLEKSLVRQFNHSPFANDQGYFYTVYIYDYQYHVGSISRYVSRLIREFDVYTTREVEGGCVRGNLVI